MGNPVNEGGYLYIHIVASVMPAMEDNVYYKLKFTTRRLFISVTRVAPVSLTQILVCGTVSFYSLFTNVSGNFMAW